jgi:histidinol-phosphatase
MSSDLDLALALADAADAITMKHFQSSTLGVRTKSDRTPVSEADEETERTLREILERERPEDAIDGTKNYVRGIPVFATLIALDDDIGVVSAPAMQRRWWASRGNGAFCNGRRLRVSNVATIENAYADLPFADGTVALMRRCARVRTFGDFWQHMLVAEGAIDIAYDPVVALWDMAAVKVIVEEAGGRFTNLAGEARADGGSGVSTNGRIHDAVLEALR